MPRGKRARSEYQSALDAAVFGRYEAEVFVDVWDELADLRVEVGRLRAAEAAANERAALLLDAKNYWLSRYRELRDQIALDAL